MSKYLTDPSQVVAGTTIRSDKYNADMQAIGVGFESVAADMLKTISMPETFSGNNTIPSMSVENTFLYINGDGDITLYSASDLQAQFFEAEAAAGRSGAFAVNASNLADEASASANEAETSRAAAVAAVSDANTSSALSQRWATEEPDIPVTTGLFSARHWSGRAQFFANQAQAVVEADYATNSRVDAVDARIIEAEEATTAVEARANTIEQLAIIGL